jgi:hypothetical protein
MTMAGIVSHLRWVEQTWFEVLFLGRPAVGPQFDETVEDAVMMVDDVPIRQLLDEYERQCRISNEIIAQHSLDDVGRHPDFKSAGATLRWMLIHLVEETARHAGHADIIRELLDGAKCYYEQRPARCGQSRHSGGRPAAGTKPSGSRIRTGGRQRVDLRGRATVRR